MNQVKSQKILPFKNVTSKSNVSTPSTVVNQLITQIEFISFKINSFIQLLDNYEKILHLFNERLSSDKLDEKTITKTRSEIDILLNTTKSIKNEINKFKRSIDKKLNKIKKHKSKSPFQSIEYGFNALSTLGENSEILKTKIDKLSSEINVLQSNLFNTNNQSNNQSNDSKEN